MADGLATFAQALSAKGLELVRGKTHTLQINVGWLCNLRCRHCHLEAGPHRVEIMSLATMEAVLAYTARVAFDTIDVTGGAPELIPHIGHFLTGLAPRSQKLIIRTNLVVLHLSTPPEPFSRPTRRRPTSATAATWKKMGSSFPICSPLPMCRWGDFSNG